MPARLLRYSACLFFLLAGTAIGISRVAPNFEGRQFGGPELVGINKHLVSRPAEELTIYDAETGALSRVSLPSGDSMDMVSLSPWIDRWGRRQMVGRWGRRDGEESDTLFRQFGLARFQFPDGALIDRVPLDVVPVSAPCWFPSIVARVLFVGGGGQIYTYSFEAPPDGPSPADLGEPRQVGWDVTGMPRCPGIVHEVAWPDRLAAARYLLVSLTPHRLPSPRAASEVPRSELWWFRLDERGRTIIDASPLVPGDRPEAALSLRRPAVGRDAGGNLELACLGQDAESRSHQLLLFPLTFDVPNGAPRLITAPSHVAATECAPVTPAFSMNGHWLTFGRLVSEYRVEVARTPLTTNSIEPEAGSPPNSP